MSQTPLDPEALAAELDRRLTETAAATDDPLIAAAARLSAAPRPTLSPEAAARIRAVMLEAQAASTSSPLRRRFGRQSIPVRLALVAALLLLIAGTVWAAQNVIPRLWPPTPIPPTATINPTAAPPLNALPMIAPTAAPSATPTMLPTVTELSSPTPSATPTQAASLIVEGPIQAIDGSTVTIFDLPVALNPTDPLLGAIRVGDVLRVEGDLAADPTVITAVRVTAVSVEIDVNPADGQVWRDPGNCGNPPPDWAPANGWRRRCQGANPGSPADQGMGMGDDD